jgi:hypothetical protein
LTREVSIKPAIFAGQKRMLHIKKKKLGDLANATTTIFPPATPLVFEHFSDSGVLFSNSELTELNHVHKHLRLNSSNQGIQPAENDQANIFEEHKKLMEEQKKLLVGVFEEQKIEREEHKSEMKCVLEEHKKAMKYVLEEHKRSMEEVNKKFEQHLEKKNQQALVFEEVLSDGVIDRLLKLAGGVVKPHFETTIGVCKTIFTTYSLTTHKQKKELKELYSIISTVYRLDTPDLVRVIRDEHNINILGMKLSLKIEMSKNEKKDTDEFQLVHMDGSNHNVIYVAINVSKVDIPITCVLSRVDYIRHSDLKDPERLCRFLNEQFHDLLLMETPKIIELYANKASVRMIKPGQGFLLSSGCLHYGLNFKNVERDILWLELSHDIAKTPAPDKQYTVLEVARLVFLSQYAIPNPNPDQFALTSANWKAAFPGDKDPGFFN